VLRPSGRLEIVVPTILVADDNSNIQKMVSLALKDEGVQVISVGNGEAAVKKMRESAPDLILADIFMPVRSGYEVCEYVKRDPKLAHIPVVLLAGAFDPFDEREAQRVGADAVLKKPFVPPDPLVNLVKTLLGKVAASQLVAVGVTNEFVSNKVVDNRPSATIAVAAPPAPKRAEMRRAESRRAAAPEPRVETPSEEAPKVEQRQAPVVEDFPVAMGQPQPERDTPPAALDQLLASAATEAATETGNKGLGGFAAWPSLVTSDSNASAPAAEEAPSQPKTEQYWPPKRNPFQHVNDQETLDLEPKLDAVSAVAPSEEQVPSPEAIELTAQTHLSAESPSAPMDEAAVTEANRSAALAPETTTATEFGENASPSTRPSPFDWLTVSSAAVEPRAAAQLSDEEPFVPPSAREDAFDSEAADSDGAQVNEPQPFHAEALEHIFNTARPEEPAAADHVNDFLLEHDFSRSPDQRVGEPATAETVEGFAAAIPASFDEPAERRSRPLFYEEPVAAEEPDATPVEAASDVTFESPAMDEAEAPTEIVVAASPWELPAGEPAQAESPQAPESVEYAGNVSEKEEVEPDSATAVEVAQAVTHEPETLQTGTSATVDAGTSLASAVEAAAKEELARSNAQPAEALAHAEPPQMNAALVQDITARIIERMQPQLLEMIQREVLRPVVEALVQRELSEK
jgi:CheY-like chemotaxis protein